MLEEELHHVEVDNVGNIMETIYKMLLKWKQKRSSQATIEELYDALRKSDRTDLAEINTVDVGM